MSAQFAIGIRKSTIANIGVPVVQWTEQGFPSGKMAFLQEFAHDITCTQAAVFKPIE
jgi:hypothetical protein